jgi:hypothetical protein
MKKKTIVSSQTAQTQAIVQIWPIGCGLPITNPSSPASLENFNTLKNKGEALIKSINI